MFKKTISLLLLLVCCIVLTLVVFAGEGRAKLSSLYIDEETWDQIIATRTEWSPEEPSEIQMADALYLNGYKVPFDRMENMLLYSLIEGDAQAYDPSVEVFCYGENAKIAFCGEAITDDLIRNNRPIRTLIYTDDRYAVYQLKCTTLPVLEIVLDASPFSIKDEAVAVDIRLFDNREEAISRQVCSAAEAHIRGRNSRSYPKNDYRLSLRTQSLGNNMRNNPLSLLGMRMDDDWIIKGQYNDALKVREVFSTNLWYSTCAEDNSFGVVNGTQYRYVELFVADYYWGIYAMCHPIDAKQLELGEGEHLYKKNFSVSEYQVDLGRKDQKQDGSELMPLWLAYKYEGGDMAHPSHAPLRAYFNTLLYAEAEEAQKLYEIADVENALDVLLFVNLIQGVDHAKGELGIYNFYIAAKQKANGEYCMLYTPWDMDRTWGFGFSDIVVMDPTLNVELPSSIVLQLKQFGDKQIVERLRQKYWNLRKDGWSEDHLVQMLQSCEENVFSSGAYDRDFNRWYMLLPEEERPAYRMGCSDFIDYVKERVGYMDQYIHQFQ